jgi:PhoPQ-activated pathogenicity-related protein
MKTRLRRAAVSVFACCVLWNAPLARGDVETYVKAPDPSFQYTVENSTEAPGLGQVLSVRLTSQTWQGIPWQHWLTILRPEKVEHADIGLLLINGGSSKSKPPSALSKEGLVVAEIARKPARWSASSRRCRTSRFSVT